MGLDIKKNYWGRAVQKKMGKYMKASGGLARPWYRSSVKEKGGQKNEKKKGHRLHSISKKVSTRWRGGPWVKVTHLKTLVSSRNRPALVYLLYSPTGWSSIESMPGHKSGKGFQGTEAGTISQLLCFPEEIWEGPSHAYHKAHTQVQHPFFPLSPDSMQPSFAFG